jgi:hypothetical protein
VTSVIRNREPKPPNSRPETYGKQKVSPRLMPKQRASAGVFAIQDAKPFECEGSKRCLVRPTAR